MARYMMVMVGLAVSGVASASEPGDAVYTLKSPADQRVTQAVERSVQAFGALIRPLARPRLKSASDWCSRYRFDLADDAITVECDGKERWSRAFSQSGGRYVDEDGRVGTMEVRRSGDRLDIVTRFDEGERQTVFEFDGDVVRVREAIRSPRLEIPVEWELVYEADAPVTGLDNLADPLSGGL